MPNALGLISQLCDALDEERITYCHWKSNDSLDRSATGENDLDLLIRRADSARFNEVLAQLGFKQAEAPAEKWIPGVTDYYGHDADGSRLVHVHAHHQLAIGHDLTKNYRLPIEEPFLRSASPNGLFSIPSPNFEYIVFVLRMVLKHLTWDTILIRNGNLSVAERHELADLRARIDAKTVDDLLRRYLEPVDSLLFQRCVQALEPGTRLWTRVRVGHEVQGVLDSASRRSRYKDAYLKFVRRVRWGARRRLLGRVPKRRLTTGGAIIAVVGGDGAGKTTVVDGLFSWFARDFDAARIHLGRPSWSWTTYVVRGALAIGRKARLYPHMNHSMLYEEPMPEQFRGKYPWMLRELCRARDRYRTYRKALRLATNGGVVISDRYPVPEVKLMDSAVIEKVLGCGQPGYFDRLLIRLERKYYARIAPPQLLIVLKVDPQVAVRRKTDEDPTETRIRSTEIWEVDWSKTRAHVLDAEHPPDSVLSAAKSVIWSEL